MGLHFPNRIGLAAGFDKNAEYIDALAEYGFGFIEIGTVTPQPQLGNPSPRIFRLPEHQAIINQLGFNNKGAEYVAHQLSQTKYKGILGINIGKNLATPLEYAFEDYLFCFRKLSPYASYFTINISSPNTPQLRNLQQEQWIRPLLAMLKQERDTLMLSKKKYLPLVVKISPDLSNIELESLATILLEEHIDGIIATNTTLTRKGVEKHSLAKKQGGLSGMPLSTQSTIVIKQLHNLLGDKIPIIASGGVMDTYTASEKYHAGAVLLQVYTGMIYHGLGIIRQLAQIIPNP